MQTTKRQAAQHRPPPHSKAASSVVCVAAGLAAAQRPRLQGWVGTGLEPVPESKSCAQWLESGTQFSLLGYGDGSLPEQEPSTGELRHARGSE